jgi:transposase
MIFVEGERKTSGLFISLLEKVIRVHPQAKVTHVILDNYRIHRSRMVQLAVHVFGGKVTLHFLPLYCPNENRIERVWKDLHANLTRNHRYTPPPRYDCQWTPIDTVTIMPPFLNCNPFQNNPSY